MARSDKRQIIPWKRAWTLILLSIVIINASALLGVTYFRYKKSMQRSDPAHNIVAIVQTTSGRDFLKPGQLPELLGLSVDQPTNLFAFDAKAAAKNLNDTGAIKQAVVKKIRPGTLHIDLALREPLAYVGNYTNTVIDAEGIMFPLKPYYTPKRIPIVYFEEKGEEKIWGSRVSQASKETAFALLSELSKVPGTRILTVDVSRAQAASFGQRQIIVSIEETVEKTINKVPIMVVAKRTLRLFPSNWSQQIANYQELRPYLNEQAAKAVNSSEKAVVESKPTTIDLRLSNLAFIGS